MDKRPQSIFHGYYIPISESEPRIVLWFSGLTGLEKVFCNDQLISTKRSFSFSSKHFFEINGDTFSLNIRVLLIFFGVTEVTLEKNRKVIKKLTLRYKGEGWKKSFLKVLFSYLVVITFVALVSFFVLYFELPRLIISLVVAVMLFAYGYRIYKVGDGSKLVIERNDGA